MDPTEKLFGALLAVLGSGLLWALGWLVKNSVWKGGLDSTVLDLKRQVEELKGEDAALATAMDEQRKANDADQRGLVGAIGDLRVAVADLTASIRARPCQTLANRGGNPGHSGNPGAPECPADKPKKG